MKEEIHLTKKDFILEWFSGSGAGGQHRNKHQNCCRITHKDSGLRAQATEHRERVKNQELAFNRLALLILATQATEKERNQSGTKVIRNYHEPRNEVIDKASGLRLTYKDVIGKRNIGPMIDARRATNPEKKEENK
jgi:protein subunit release factor B